MHKVCNKCGKDFQMKNGIYLEDFLEVNKVWGYFSQKDGEKHQIIICEECYNKWIEQLLVPVKIEELNELV